MLADLSARSDVKDLLRWLVAGALAFAALVGVVSLLAVVVFSVGELSAWATYVVGGALALGTAAFAWILASALRR